MPQPAARLGDLHVCPMTPPPGLPIAPPCMVNVLIGKRPAARAFDLCTCVAPPPIDPIARGSTTVLIGMRPAARMGDQTAKAGVIITGEFTVLIGG